MTREHIRVTQSQSKSSSLSLSLSLTHTHTHTHTDTHTYTHTDTHTHTRAQLTKVWASSQGGQRPIPVVFSGVGLELRLCGGRWMGVKEKGQGAQLGGGPVLCPPLSCSRSLLPYPLLLH